MASRQTLRGLSARGSHRRNPEDFFLSGRTSLYADMAGVDAVVTGLCLNLSELPEPPKIEPSTIELTQNRTSRNRTSEPSQ